MGFPITNVITAVSTVVGVAKKGTDMALQYAQAYDIAFDQNYKVKRLALELSNNYTTSAKNVTGSVIPEAKAKTTTFQSSRLEELVDALYNQTRGINIK